MARKKKSRHSVSRGIEESCVEDAVVCASNGPLDHAFLELRLLRSSSSASTYPSSSARPGEVQKPPLVCVTSADASRLSLENNDKVLVLAQEKKDEGGGESTATITGTAICLVRIVPVNGTSDRLGSPRGQKSPGQKKSIRLSRGTFQIFPISVAETLCSKPGSKHETPQSAAEQANTPTMATSSIPPHQASPTSGFSFAKGGTRSPSSPQQNVSTPSIPSPLDHSGGNFLIVPLQSSLGHALSTIICNEAQHVLLESTSDVLSSTDATKAAKVLEKLVLATNLGNYVRRGDLVSTSFQGRTLGLKVRDIDEISIKSNEVDGVEHVLQNLHIEDGSLSSSDNDPVVSSLRNSLLRFPERVRLFKLTSSTTVTVFTDTAKSVVSLKHPSPSDENQEPNTRVVAGLDSTIERIKSLLLPPLQKPHLFSDTSLSAPKGVLLYGPSGVGKTLVGKQIALDLQGTTIHVESINCTSLQSHTALVGEAERRLSKLFHSVEAKSSGALLILDDVHLICPKRGKLNSSAGVDRLGATLLAMLDGVGTTAPNSRNLVVLAITANPTMLDPALRRPGRLDAEVEIPIPDEMTRSEILRYQLKALEAFVDMPSFTDDDIMSLSRLAKGFTGADSMLAIKEAIRQAIKSNPLLPPESRAKLALANLETSIRSTKPSSISSAAVEIPQVQWSSIGGMESVKEKLREAIELPITHAHLFEALHIPPPRGVLLFGPPGCSKTLMARALATEGRMNFLAVKGPELLSKWLGESERALASLFRRARMASPCIIFFDEIDAIASKRGGGGDGTGGGGERLLSQLLTELDGVSHATTSAFGATKQGRVVVVAATNRPDLLDSALMRPGRIDRMIYVGLPDQSSRERIFEIGLKERACSEDVDIRHLASDEMSAGYSGAEIIGICREAALLAIAEDDEKRSWNLGEASSPEIAMRHMRRATEGMQRQVTQEMLDFYESYK